MFERLSTGWELAKQSIGVLKLDKELLLFPVFSGICCLIVLATFGVPIFFSGLLDDLGNQQQETSSIQNIVMFVVLFLFYFVNYFVIIFFNSALVGCAIIRLKGGDPTVRDGISAAMARLPQIAAWALVSATVGLILKAIESRSERVGQIVANLLGMAWSITTFFVVPILVVEKTGPVDAVKRSVAIMKKTWGESLAANVGIGVITFLVGLVAVIPLMCGVAALAAEMTALGIALIVIGVLCVLTVSLVSSALNSIVLAALYIYATEDQVPNGFDANMVKRAFGSKS